MPNQRGGLTADARADPDPELRYRIVCYELDDDQQIVILDATAHAFIAVPGMIDENNTMRGTAPMPDRSCCYDASPA